MLLRLFLRWFGRLIEALFTRTTVTGQDNIPAQGPVIFAGNHASTYDPTLWTTHLPLETRMVGPGDFKMLFPANLVVEHMGLIRIQRGAADRDSLKEMMSVLKEGHMLALFPEGGTWEKRLDDVKPGAAYLSLMTGAPIIPVSIGGTYQVWRKIVTLQRPRITIHFGEPMEPVVSLDRKNRQAELRQASLDLIARIYAHLPPEEQARYDLHAHQQFTGRLEFAPDTLPDTSSVSLDVLAELVSKPNLFSPLHQNLKLPLDPLVQQARFHPADSFSRAADALMQAFETIVPGYISYRLGDQKAVRLTNELQQLKTLSQQAAEHQIAMRFVPQIHVLENPLPPNS